MFRKIALTVLSLALLVMFVGCAENKLTKHNFDMIKKGVSTKLEVENTLGKPTADRGECWEYENEDQHLTAYIHWSREGKVERKEWIDAKRDIWEGAAPGIDEQPEGRKASERRSNVTIDKDH
jgi:hypothetical protein